MRRHELVGRSRSLRAQLVVDVQALAPALATADKVRNGIHWLKHNPVWLGVAVTTLVVWKPSRLWRWGRKIWTVWKLWRRLQNVWYGPQLEV